MDEEAKEHFACCIAVGFTDSTLRRPGACRETSVFIDSTDPDRLRLLNDAIRDGGIPVGLIKIDQSPGEVTGKARTYPECDQKWATAYMDGLMAELFKWIESVTEKGGTLPRPVRGRSRRSPRA